MSAAPRAAGSGGFALVEALASLVVVAMMALMLAAGVTTGRRVWERMDTREAVGESLDSAQTVLRDRIEQIFPQTKYDENPPYSDFTGKAETMVFLANPPLTQRPAPLRRYTLSLDTAGELILSSVNDAAFDQKRAPVLREVLLTGVRQMDLAYFGPFKTDPQRRWRPVWYSDPDLPEIVRVRLTFEPGDPRQWPDLIVRPRTTVDSACLLNPVTHHCKGRL